jgi:GH25 family lysozyme M1 (1,4-beta-N-acetylmuramidase)
MVIDISYANGNVDFDKIKAAGVDAVIIRCGFGKDYKKQDDEKFERNINGAHAAGIRTGVYFYSYAKDANAAKSESAHCLRLINPYKEFISMPIFYDVEESSIQKAVKTTVPIFISAMNDAGFNAGVYASKSWFSSYLKGVTIPFKWIAAWGNDDGKPHKQPEGADVWQYTSRGKVDGITGVVDCDIIINENLSLMIGGDSAINPQPQPGNNDNDSNNQGGDKVNITLTVLKKGSKGGEVKTIQMLLNEIGFRDQNGAFLANDGIFGIKTEYAVKNYQRKRGLTVDGIVGFETWNRILK